jgi:DNA-binding protein Fis
VRQPPRDGCGAISQRDTFLKMHRSLSERRKCPLRDENTSPVKKYFREVDSKKISCIVDIVQTQALAVT